MTTPPRRVCTNSTNVPWLKSIPPHWRIIASKRLFSERKERARSDDEQLSATQTHGVILQKEYERLVGRKVVQILQHLDKRRHVEKDDFIISMRSFQGGLERAWCRGAIRSSYVVLRPGAQVHVPFFAHLFKSHPFIHAIRATSNFIRDGQDLNFNNFCLVDLPIIPLEEQEAAASYLDAVGLKVNRFIRNKRRLIELLHEQKQAIITQAITRGLNPSAKLKPSGIYWLGEVPKHWTLKPFKHCVRFRSGQVDPKIEPYASYVLIAPDHIEKRTGQILDTVSARTQGAISGKYLVSPNDVIYSKIRPALRKAALSPGRCLCSADMYPLMPVPTELLPEYLLLLLLADPFTRYVVDCSMRVAMPKVNRDALGACWLWYPSLAEQKELLSAIAVATAPLTKAIVDATREIDLVREYRMRLIADVVTGKVDIRHLASPEYDGKPVEPEELDADVTAEDESELVEETADTGE